MKFDDIYVDFKNSMLNILNSKENNEYLLPLKLRDALISQINSTEDNYIAARDNVDNIISKLENTIYIENTNIEEQMTLNKELYLKNLEDLRNREEEETNAILAELNQNIEEITREKKIEEKRIDKEIDKINRAIAYEQLAYDSNLKYYNDLIEKASKRYDKYNNIIYSKILNIDATRPKQPRFNPQSKKINRILDSLKYYKDDDISVKDPADGDKFQDLINAFPKAKDDIITSIEDHAMFQTRIDNLNAFLEEMNSEFSKETNKIELIKHEVSSDYNRKLSTSNKNFSESINQSKLATDRKLKSIDKRVEQQKKKYADESAKISEDYVSHITNISNEITNLDKENKRLIDNYNREYYFSYYKTLFEYNTLINNIRQKTGYSDSRNKQEQKRLDNFEIKAYLQKLKSLKLKHDKYIEQLNINIMQQINHNNYEISESNLYKAFDLTTSKIKHEAYLKKSKILKDNIEKTSSYTYTISSLEHDKKILELRFNDYDSKRQELDYEIKKVELEYHARRDKIEEKIRKYIKLKDEYIKFIDNDNMLLKRISDSNHNTKLSIYYFEIRKNNILKEFNRTILSLAIKRASAIKDYNILIYNKLIDKYEQELYYFLESSDLRLKYFSNKYTLKYNYINSKYKIKVDREKNEYTRKKNIKAIYFERNTFRYDNIKSQTYSDYIFSIYSYTNILHMTMATYLKDYKDLLNRLNHTFVNFYNKICNSYYENEQENLENRLNNIYYYKNSVSIKKLEAEKNTIENDYKKRIINLLKVNKKYESTLELINTNSTKVNINPKRIKKVKRRLIKDIKVNNNEITKLKEGLIHESSKIDYIIARNKKSSIVHYQNYNIFKKTMHKLLHQALKQINSILHKAKSKDLELILEEHINYIQNMKLTIYRIFKNFTTGVENEFPKESRKHLNTYNHYVKVYDNKTNAIFNQYDKKSRKISNELTKSLKLPYIKQKRYIRSYNLTTRVLQIKYNNNLKLYSKKIHNTRYQLVDDLYETNTLIQKIQENNLRIIKHTKEEQQTSTNNYISTIFNIKNTYIANIYEIDRLKKINLNDIKVKYKEAKHSLESIRDKDIVLCNRDIKGKQQKQRDLQKSYSKTSSNIDADLINDRVDQQILLSQKLKKLKRLFVDNKDLSELDDNYNYVKFSDYDEFNPRIE